MIHPYLYAGLPTANMNYSEVFNDSALANER